MRRRWAILGSLCFFLLAPGLVAGLVPWWISRWRMQSPFLGLSPLRLAAGVDRVGSAGPAGPSCAIVLEGLGTPSPIVPARHLVVTGLYRYARNPMYLIVPVIAGQSASGECARAGLWSAGLVGGSPFRDWLRGALRRTFGAEDQRFCANVPRWIPRLRPWRGE
jgi:hypothetical protein